MTILIIEGVTRRRREGETEVEIPSFRAQRGSVGCGFIELSNAFNRSVVVGPRLPLLLLVGRVRFQCSQGRSSGKLRIKGMDTVPSSIFTSFTCCSIVSKHCGGYDDVQCS
ncbi:uncharacterized protein LOC111270677 [Varroa jacobsoni]|uniref:uncharacterized protein LOC111270677 n=1 Tax=Varroa jacobsoni TaxID=62625 RepID=UPI000BF2F365|nr:uncharacterized protein LOC111270677 [Varroa jacobsoni]